MSHDQQISQALELWLERLERLDAPGAGEALRAWIALPADRAATLAEARQVARAVGHPRVLQSWQQGALSDDTRDAIEAALLRLLPQANVRPSGGVEAMLANLDRALDAAARLAAAIEAALPSRDEAERAAILTRFLGRDPAPLLIAHMRRAWPDAMRAAEAMHAEATDLTITADHAEALRTLREADHDHPEALAATLATLTARDEAHTWARVALTTGDADAALLGAAVLTALGRKDDIFLILARAILATEDTAPLAILAIELDAETTIHTLALRLAEARLAHTTTPDEPITPTHKRAFVAMRCVMHGPQAILDSVASSPAAEEDPDGLLEVPRRVEVLRGRWRAARQTPTPGLTATPCPFEKG